MIRVDGDIPVSSFWKSIVVDCSFARTEASFWSAMIIERPS